MTDTEERLRAMVERRDDRIRELEADVRRLTTERDAAEFRVRNELEPMVAQRDRAYDDWATSPEREATSHD